MLQTTTITTLVAEFHFAFDPETDDPLEGVTLTAIIQDGRRVAPSKFQGSIPYAVAERRLIKGESGADVPLVDKGLSGAQVASLYRDMR